jgi:hypothetical protein
MTALLRRLVLVAGTGAVLLGVPASFAQTAPPSGELITGAQLQTWLDQRFSYSGVHHGSGCVILNTSGATGRVLFIRCPNGWAEKLTGTAKVVGDTMCTNFPIPNTPAGDDCVSWYSAGGWKFEQRKGTTLDTTVMMLPQGLSGAK